MIRSLLASALRGKDYQVEEEVHGLSTNGSTRRIDIIAIPTRSTSGFIIDQLTISSGFTVLLAQSLEFTVSRTTDLQRQFTVLELRSLQLRSTALELRPSDADADADAHSSRTPVHKTGLLALAFSLTG
ncbi:hypothetical protein ANN_16801 [Periplaneta americana]|uniref:Uncharacterized protein n=1 Tax=Periplaneta americana TaxID=6978 RepID=A0ABQ8SSH0_PERAM|nr:hypothetical protein ANN_16801 [Periplaneta americana]